MIIDAIFINNEVENVMRKYCVCWF